VTTPFECHWSEEIRPSGPQRLEHFGHYTDRHLRGRVRSDIQADRSMDILELRFVGAAAASSSKTRRTFRLLPIIPR
jgi:hypothetical protein